MITVSTLLLIVALVFFIIAAIGWPSPSRFNFIACGLAFWVASILFAGGLRIGNG